jgi:hypothetical protein
MVRIFEVKDLQQKKKELIARSDIHRQTLAREATNIKLSLELLKKRLRVLRTIYRVLGLAVPVGGLLFGHKEPERKASFISKFLSGFDLARRIKSFFNRNKADKPAAEQADEPSRF